MFYPTLLKYLCSLDIYTWWAVIWTIKGLIANDGKIEKHMCLIECWYIWNMDRSILDTFWSFCTIFNLNVLSVSNASQFGWYPFFGGTERFSSSQWWWVMMKPYWYWSIYLLAVKTEIKQSTNRKQKKEIGNRLKPCFSYLSYITIKKKHRTFPSELTGPFSTKFFLLPSSTF